METNFLSKIFAMAVTNSKQRRPPIEAPPPPRCLQHQTPACRSSTVAPCMSRETGRQQPMLGVVGLGRCAAECEALELGEAVRHRGRPSGPSPALGSPARSRSHRATNRCRPLCVRSARWQGCRSSGSRSHLRRRRRGSPLGGSAQALSLRGSFRGGGGREVSPMACYGEAWGTSVSR